MTAAELAELCGSAEEVQTLRLSELYRANEYLAFNTAALCLAAFNAPEVKYTITACKTVRKSELEKTKAVLKSAGFEVVSVREVGEV